MMASLSLNTCLYLLMFGFAIDMSLLLWCVNQLRIQGTFDGIFATDNSTNPYEIEDFFYNYNYFRHHYQDTETNDTYWLYRVEIGKLFIEAQDLSDAEILHYTHLIADHTIHYSHSPHHWPERAHYYDSYFNEKLGEKWQSKDFFALMNLTNNIETVPMDNDSRNITFFMYNQTVIEYENNTENINFTVKYDPILYNYVIALNENGDLWSLSLKFGQMIDMEQNYNVGHMILNRNNINVLWCGEMWVFYDYKYRKYVAVLDNASGHYKPKHRKKPPFLLEILRYSLFAKYNGSNDGYQPILMKDRHWGSEWIQNERTSIKERFFPWRT